MITINATDRKPVEEMTIDEKLEELVTKVRMIEDALSALSDSPMAKMLPGMSKLFGK